MVCSTQAAALGGFKTSSSLVVALAPFPLSLAPMLEVRGRSKTTHSLLLLSCLVFSCLSSALLILLFSSHLLSSRLVSSRLVSSLLTPFHLISSLLCSSLRGIRSGSSSPRRQALFLSDLACLRACAPRRVLLRNPIQYFAWMGSAVRGVELVPPCRASAKDCAC